MRTLKRAAMLLLLAAMILPTTVSYAAADMDLVDTAACMSDISTFVQLVRLAGLECALKAAGPFTVFAPSNEAFAMLPVATINNLVKPENRETLKTVLMYHLTNGNMTSGDFTKMQLPTNVTSLSGQAFDVKSGKMGLMVNCAIVIKPDNMATNGVIHVIDRVLIPGCPAGLIPPPQSCPAGTGCGPCPQVAPPCSSCVPPAPTCSTCPAPVPAPTCSTCPAPACPTCK